MNDEASSRTASLILRLGLLGTAMVLLIRAYDLWIYGHSAQYPLSFVLSFTAWGSGMLLGLLALTRHIHRRAAWLILGGLVMAFFAFVFIYWRNRHPLITPRTDNQMIAEYAVQLLRHGQNPYEWNLTDFRRVFHDQLNFTAFLDGSLQRRVTYPALPIWFLYGLDSIGLGSVKLISVAAHTALLSLLFIGSPRTFRPVVLLPLFAFKEFVYFPLAGLQDVLWCALLVGMIMVWDRPILRAVLFGLACNYRQQPWLIAPFLVIHLWYTHPNWHERVRAIAVFTGVSLGLFLVINLPFIVWNPKAWALGAFEPTYAAFNVWSQGIGALTQFGFVSWPKSFYSILQFSFYGMALLYYWQHPRTTGHAFWLVPGVFFWIYYRALTNYWIYWIPPLLLILSRSVVPRTSLDRALPARQTNWLPTACICGAVVVANVMLGVSLLLRGDAVTARVEWPILTTARDGSDRVSKIRVDVTNHSEAVFKPRFSMQQEQPYPWLIESGPIRLEPGQSGTYTIVAGYRAVQFAVGDGAQIVVTDEGGDYSLRSVLDIPSDQTFGDPDRIVNPRYEFFSETGQTPIGWEFLDAPRGTGAITMTQFEGRNGLVFEVKPGTQAFLRLSQTITLPDSLDLWVYPTHPVLSPEGGHVYGLEVFDGIKRLWVLFGVDEGYGMVDASTTYVVIPTPPNQWSRQHVDLPALFERVGWTTPPLTMRISNSLNSAARQIELSLIFATPGREHITAVFGAIEQAETQRAGSTDYLEQALCNPAEYYVGLGIDYLNQRNFDLALEAFERAIEHDPTQSDAWFGLSETFLWRDEWDAAMEAYQESIELGYPQPERFYEAWVASREAQLSE